MYLTSAWLEGKLETHRITQSFDKEPQNPMKQLLPGTMLMNRYLIQDVVGVGGMGSVYRARDMHFPNVIKLVAVKEMINSAPDPLVRQTIVANFEREANILVTLDHPTIPKIFDYFSQSDKSYLVEEFINGKDLEALLVNEPSFFPESQVIAWAIEICDVVSYLHAHQPEPIIFRDIKPSNIMINQKNRVILVDFGIAKVFRSGQKGTMIGTEGYSPPEQYRGEISPLVDVYALGATLHHVLTRRDPRLEPPFSFGERPIRQINPAVSPELEIIVNTALQYNPGDRFVSMDAMRDALLAVAKKTGALSHIHVQGSSREQTVKPIWSFKCEDEIRGAPAHDNGIVFVGSYDNNLYALNALDGAFLWKYPTQGGLVCRPAISEQTVYIGSEDSRLYAVAARSGKPVWDYKTEGSIRCSPAVAEGHVFTGSDDGYLYAVNTLSGRLTWRMDAGETIRSSPVVTQEGVYFGCENGDFICADFRGQLKWRYHAKRAITAGPHLANGVVYFTSLDSMVYALDAKSGWMMWRYRMGKGSVSSPCRHENYLLVGSADQMVYCLDANTSKEIWTFKTGHQVSGSPVVYKDAVYCGSADGNFYSLETKNGRLRWKFSTGGPITSAPLIINDVVYVGSADHILYALMA